MEMDDGEVLGDGEKVVGRLWLMGMDGGKLVWMLRLKGLKGGEVVARW